MKIRLLILFLLCTVIYSFGQTSIRGRIKDLQQNLPFVTVRLLNSDSALIKNTVTDDAGKFIFEDIAPGNYFISSSAVGHSKFFSQLISVEKNNIELPDIILEPVSTELTEVTVKTKKPLFEQKIDRLVVNVQSSVTSSGSSVLEVLEKSPGIVLNRQNNTITMNGKTGVRIMINGKSTPLPLEMVIQMLDGMSSSNVEKIELITNPPAKYDAEGAGGIIHIVMKGNADLGTNGSVGFTLGCKWAEVLGGSFNLNHRNKNFAFVVDYSILSEHNLHSLNLIRQFVNNGFVQTINDHSRRENNTTQQNANAGIEWKLSKNSLLNFSLTDYRRKWDMNAATNDSYHVAKDSTVVTSMSIHESNIWQSVTAGIGLQSKMNSKTEISFNLDYLYYHNNNPSQYDNKPLSHDNNADDVSKIDVKKTTPIRFLIATTDYKHVYSPFLSLEAGLKSAISSLDNDVLVQRLQNNVWLTDPTFTSYSNLSEQVAAAYIATKWQPEKQWQINSGLRYEYAHTSIGTPEQKNLLNRKQGYLFPNLTLEKDFSKNKYAEFSYSRRITRPTYNEIAPFVFFWGPNSFDAGNTELLPAVSDAIKMGYHARQWVVSLQFSHSKNEIDMGEPENDSSNNVIYRHQNLKYSNILGLMNAWSFNIAPWWEVQTNLVAQYKVVQTSHLPVNVKRRNYGLSLNMTSSLKLPKDFAIEISGMYQSKTLLDVVESMGVGSLNAGIQKKFGKGTVRFAVDDIFNTNVWRLKLNLPNDKNMDTYLNYDPHSQFFRLTYTRSFGNNKLSSINLKTKSQEERGRIQTN
ncbi:MAG TPA: outer membrane beta-barrel family protein [Chitinophagaceae bacterium]|jgi:hypothetical protein|nr:outer membrane beta-barrel family protein [Chitinophagaceae bacterium]